MITIAIIEDQEETRELLANILALEKELLVTGIYSNGESAIKSIPKIKPDIVLVDIVLPDLSGAECIKKIRKLIPDQNFMVFTIFDDESHVFEALEAGASSYVLKSSDPKFLLQSIKDLHNGGSPMSPEIARIIVNKLFKRTGSTFRITEKEKEILGLLSKGMQYKEIAEKLHISVNTLKVHCYNIYQKLHVNNKVEAINKMNGNID